MYQVDIALSHPDKHLNRKESPGNHAGITTAPIEIACNGVGHFQDPTQSNLVSDQSGIRVPNVSNTNQVPRVQQVHAISNIIRQIRW